MGCRCDDLYSCEFKAWLTLAFLCSLAEWLKCVVMLTCDTGHIRHTTFSLFYINYIFFLGDL